MNMPPLKSFKRLDVRPILESGGEPLPRILQAIYRLSGGEGLLVIAPFLPSPLIEKLAGEGFASKVERGSGADWMVYFWREND
jgi:uncharacterized protein (DUF2249 family)